MIVAIKTIRAVASEYEENQKCREVVPRLEWRHKIRRTPPR